MSHYLSEQATTKAKRLREMGHELSKSRHRVLAREAAMLLEQMSDALNANGAMLAAALQENDALKGRQDPPNGKTKA